MIQYSTVRCRIAIYSFKTSLKLRGLNSEYYSWIYHSQSADRENRKCLMKGNVEGRYGKLKIR